MHEVGLERPAQPHVVNPSLLPRPRIPPAHDSPAHHLSPASLPPHSSPALRPHPHISPPSSSPPSGLCARSPHPPTTAAFPALHPSPPPSLLRRSLPPAPSSLDASPISSRSQGFKGPRADDDDGSVDRRGHSEGAMAVRRLPRTLGGRDGGPSSEEMRPSGGRGDRRSSRGASGAGVREGGDDRRAGGRA